MGKVEERLKDRRSGVVKEGQEISVSFNGGSDISVIHMGDSELHHISMIENTISCPWMLHFREHALAVVGCILE